VFPDWVQPSGEGVLQVDTYPILIYSAAAIQQLTDKLRTKDDRLEALEKQHVTLLKRLEVMESRVSNMD